MLKRFLAFGLVAVLSLGFLAACGSSDETPETPATRTSAASSNAPAIFTATAQSELEDTWTPTPEPEHPEGGEGGGEASGPVALNISAVDIAYDQTELSGPAGVDFTITLTNDGAADHDFVIEGTDFKTEILAGGASETITVNLPAGEYTFYCSVPGHRAAGMEGTLTIAEGGGAPAGGQDAPAGGQDAPAAPSGPVELAVSAVDIAFEETSLEAPADTDFTITVTNNGAADHDFVIEGTDFKTEILAGGTSETITVNLPAGEYTYFCSVPGHRQAGMEGTLTVSEGGGVSVAPPADTSPAPPAGGDSAAASGPVEIQVSAVDIAYEETTLEAPADTDFTITVTNNGAAQHDLNIEGTDFKTKLLNAGESDTITVNLPAGEYIYFCSVPGHRQAGMWGTLTVSEGGGVSMAPAAESTPAPAAATGSTPAPAAGGDSAAASGSVDVPVSAVDIAFEETTLTGPADTDFTITLTNNGTAQHDFVIEGTDFKTSILNGGQSQTITVNLPAGEYTYFCSVPGHRAAGMEGTLTISADGGASMAPAAESTPAPAAESTPAPVAAADSTPAATGDSDAASGPVDVQVSAVDIAFEETTLAGPADTDFTITVTNNGVAQHDFVIEGTDFKTDLLNAGESQTLTVNLPAGEYTYYCSVPGHRASGMEGTLTISADGGATMTPATDATPAASPEASPAASPEAAGAALTISAVDIAFDKKEMEAPADTDFTITVTNDGVAQHDLVIEGTDFKTTILNGGQSDTITVNLPAGEYTFYCSIPGHRAAGMVGTLIVK
ncbi:MAG: cupredoxin domain-containing protein [Thermomicrobiales bacterium]